MIEHSGRSRLRRRLTFTFAVCTPQPPSDRKMQRFSYASFCAALVLAAALGQQAGAIRSGWCFTERAGKTRSPTCSAQVVMLAVRIPPSRTDPACPQCLLERAVAVLRPPIAFDSAHTRSVGVTAPNGRARSNACAYVPVMLSSVAGAHQRARAAAAVPS